MPVNDDLRDERVMHRLHIDFWFRCAEDYFALQEVESAKDCLTKAKKVAKRLFGEVNG